MFEKRLYILNRLTQLNFCKFLVNRLLRQILSNVLVRWINITAEDFLLLGPFGLFVVSA